MKVSFQEQADPRPVLPLPGPYPVPVHAALPCVAWRRGGSPVRGCRRRLPLASEEAVEALSLSP